MHEEPSDPAELTEPAKKEPRIDSEMLLELARMKLQLVEQDYSSYFEATTRNIERISQLRNLEVTLITAISVVLITRTTFPFLAVMPLYLLILIFYVQNAGLRSGVLVMEEDAIRQEKKLHANTMSEFTYNIAKWTFGNTLVRERALQKRKYYFAKSLLAPEIIMWHGGLILAVTALLLAATL